MLCRTTSRRRGRTWQWASSGWTATMTRRGSWCTTRTATARRELLALCPTSSTHCAILTPASQTMLSPCSKLSLSWHCALVMLCVGSTDPCISLHHGMQAIVDWCDATGGSSTAFDFTTKVRRPYRTSWNLGQGHSGDAATRCQEASRCTGCRAAFQRHEVFTGCSS